MQFLPLYQPSAEAPAYNELAEQDFFKSCSALALANGIELINVADQPFPINILMSYWDIYHQLQHREISLDLQIIELDDHRTTLISKQQIEISYTVFHIPVRPLFQLLNDKAQQASTPLLLSVYAYLYQRAGISYYRDRDAAMYDIYEMFESMLKEEKDDFTKEEYAEDIPVYIEARRIGDQIGKRIFNPRHLEQLPSRIANYLPRNENEYRCLQMAKMVLLLMRDFPNANLMRNMHHQEQEDDEGWVGADLVFSFVYANDDALSDRVLSLISDEFGNCGNTDQPTAYRVYNKENEEPVGLEYEIRLIALIEELIYVLKNFK